MSIGIGRKRTFGLAIESSYGVAEASPTFYLSQVEPLVIEEVVTVAENQANLGSSYETDETYNAVRYANITLNAKLDEDSFPALLAQNFDISSVTATGESAVYEHELTFNSNNQLKSFTLFLDDDDRESELIKGLILNGINLIVERKGIRVEASGVGFYPSAYGGNVTVTQPKHFVGRKTQFELTTNTGTLAVYNVLTLQLNHTFNITGEDDNFYLNSANGDLDLDNVFTTGVRFEEPFTTHYSDNTIRDYWAAGTAMQTKTTITDTSREVDGAVAGTNPSVTIEYPEQKVIEWSKDGGQNDILKENFNLLAIDKVGVTDAPAKFTVVNATASY